MEAIADDLSGREDSEVLRPDSLIVHDLYPDPKTRARWLESVAGAPPLLSGFVVQRRADAPALTQFLRRCGRSVRTVGVGFQMMESEARLGLRLQELTRPLWKRRVLAALGDFPEPLVAVATKALKSEVPTTVTGLCHQTHFSQNRLREETREAGLATPLPFLHAVRVLSAQALLRKGSTVRGASEVLGYGKPDTLRRHFQEVLGLTPTEARRHRLKELVRRIAR